MSLQGSIKTIALPYVLELLASTRQSGELTLVTERGQGRIWMEDGRLVDHEVAACRDWEDALFELLRAHDGTFDFDAGDTAGRGAPADLGPVLAAAHARLGQWHVIAAVVPSLSHRVSLAEELSSESVEVDRDQWGLVLAIGEGNPVHRVLERCGLSEYDGCSAIKGLVELGLAEVSEPGGDQGALSAAAPAPAWVSEVQDADGLDLGMSFGSHAGDGAAPVELSGMADPDTPDPDALPQVSAPLGSASAVWPGSGYVDEDEAAAASIASEVVQTTPSWDSLLDDSRWDEVVEPFEDIDYGAGEEMSRIAEPDELGWSGQPGTGEHQSLGGDIATESGADAEADSGAGSEFPGEVSFTASPAADPEPATAEAHSSADHAEQHEGATEADAQAEYWELPGNAADAAEGETEAEAEQRPGLAVVSSFDYPVTHATGSEPAADPGAFDPALGWADAPTGADGAPSDGDGDQAAREPINKSLLLKFLASVRN